MGTTINTSMKNCKDYNIYRDTLYFVECCIICWEILYSEGRKPEHLDENLVTSRRGRKPHASTSQAIGQWKSTGKQPWEYYGTQAHVCGSDIPVWWQLHHPDTLKILCRLNNCARYSWTKCSTCINGVNFSCYLQETSRDTPLWFSLFPIDTSTHDGQLMLWNCFISFAVEHRFSRHATEPGFARGYWCYRNLTDWLTESATASCVYTEAFTIYTYCTAVPTSYMTNT